MRQRACPSRARSLQATHRPGRQASAAHGRPPPHRLRARCLPASAHGTDARCPARTAPLTTSLTRHTHFNISNHPPSSVGPLPCHPSLTAPHPPPPPPPHHP